jgi:hypothetical protein
MILHVGGTARGTLPPIVDPADGITPVTPSALTALVIKNGTDTVDSVTITAVGGGRTGVYKWSYDPAGEVEGDRFSLVFTITIDSLPYYYTVDLEVLAVERGTDDSPGIDDIGELFDSYDYGTRFTALDMAISALQSSVTSLNNLSAKANWFGALLLEVPDSGTRAYCYELVVRDDEDKLVNLDALPTVTLTNTALVDRSSLITSALGFVAHGRYQLTITIASETVNEALKLTATGAVGGETRYATIMPQVVDYDSATQINTILTRIGLPSVTLADDLVGVRADTENIQSRLPPALVSGRMDSSTGAMATSVITASAIAANAIGASELAADAVAEIQSGLMLAASYTAPDNAGITALNDRLTASRAGYLDNLNVSGPVASQADINSLNQSASRRVILQTVGQWEMPESGTTLYTIELRTFDGDGASVNADANPTITVTGQTTGSLAANVGGISNPATGVYRWLYSVASNATIEPVRIDTSATIGGSAFPMSVYTQVTDFVGVEFTVTDRNNINAIFNKLPSRGFLTGTSTATGALLPADVGLASANLDTQLSTINTNASSARTASESADGKLTAPRLARIDGAAQSGADNDTLKTLSDQIDLTATATGVSSLFTTLTTKIRKFFQLSLRKDSAIATDNATELTEINATGGSGTGSYANTTDSLEAVRDRGDAAWASGSGSGTESSLMVSTTIATLASQTSFTLTAGSADNSAYNNQLVVITDASTSIQKARGIVSDYVGSTRTVILQEVPVFTIAVGDLISIIAVGSVGGGSSAVGTGADQVSIYIKDDGVGVPDVSVWITTDSVGATVIAGTLTTDATGKVLFLLDAGTTYYLWAKKSGKISITGQSFVAVADT